MAKNKKTAESETKLVLERRTAKDRRAAEDRRTKSIEVPKEKRTSQRRAVTRRRQIDPSTCERDYTNDEIEFMQAMDAYKRSSGRMFPTCSEVLEVVRSLGYEKPRPDSSSPADAAGETSEQDAAIAPEADAPLESEVDLDEVSLD